MTTTPDQLYLMAPLAVVGHDPELADMTNPRGEIVREIFVLIAELAGGKRYALDYHFGEDHRKANRILEKVEAAGKINLKHWSEIEPTYGTEEWERWNLDK